MELAMVYKLDSIEEAYEYANSAAGGVHLYIEKMGYTYVQSPWRPGHGPRVECFRSPRAAALHALLNTDLEELRNDYAVLTLVDKDGTHYYAASIGHPAGFTPTGTPGFIQFLNDDDWQEEARHQPIDNLKQDA